MTSRRFPLASSIFGLSLLFALTLSWRAAQVGAAKATTAQPTALSSGAAAQSSPATIIRTIVFRQISDFQSGGNVGNIHVMRMSADGSKIIFASGQKVFTMDTTGANLREIFVNPNPATIPAPSFVDINANGSKVLWSSRNFFSEFYVANSDGSSRVRIAPTAQDRFGSTQAVQMELGPRLTADGSRVYFIGQAPVDVSGGYRVNADGSGLTRLFTYRQMAQLFGKTENDFNGFSAFIPDFDISDDGSRMVFGTDNFGGHLITFDGTTLRRLADFNTDNGSFSHRIVISGDGRTIVAKRSVFGEPTSPAFAIDFDGSTQPRKILENLGSNVHHFGELTRNGAQVINVSPPYSLTLVNTDGSGRLDLVIPGDCDVNLLQPSREPVISLSADGRRFAFVTAVPGVPQQIWIGDINPSSTGDAPRITDVAFNPSYVTADGLTTSTFTARATDAQGGQAGLRRRICSNTLKNGAYESRYLSGGTPFGIALFDDGTNGGDQTANDGLFTQTQVRRDSAPPDPITPLQIRHHAIATSLRQVTAVDATPFFVLAQAPSGAAPVLTSITPSSGNAGIQVKLTGSGFDPVAANNIVLFGNRQAVVRSATADRTMLEVIVPPDLPAGTVPVTVTVAGQTSNAVNFTGTGGTGGGVTINDHRMTAGPIPNNCEPPTPKSNFAPTDALAYQWTSISGSQTGALIRWEWMQPNGSIFKQFQATLNNTNPNVCFWDAIDIAGSPAASLPGNWQVRVFYNNALIATDNFTISATQPTPTPNPQCIAVSIPTNLTGSAGGTLTVPIMVSDTTGRNALSYDAVLTFDPAVLRLQSPAFDRAGTLSAGLSVTTNNPTPGRLNISGFSSTPLAGSGVLLNLKFDVIGALNACSALNWMSFRFNEGTPCSTATGGRACAVGGSIAGAVSYCAATPAKPVPGVTINAAGTPSASATTDAAGNYQLPNLGGGSYTLTPTKTGDANGITSFDAAQIAQHVVGIITLNECQRAAADTSNNGEITSFDAAFIAQYVVGISNATNITGTWKFLPATRSYPTLSGNQTAQNFSAVLMGELTGNWTPGGTSFAEQALTAATANPAQQASIALPTITAAPNTAITVPITIGNLTGQGVIAYDFDLIFDASVLQAQSAPVDATGTLSSALTVTANATPGRLRVSAFGTQPLSGAGTLLNLKFNVTGAGGTALTWQRFLLNETAQTSLTSGRVNTVATVASVSAASFSGTALASESIVAAFGVGLATTTQLAATVPLPTTLAGTTVSVRDALGIERNAPLFFVSPAQINYLLPPGTAAGAATVTVSSGQGIVALGALTIAAVAPGLFAADANGQGLAAATALRIKADGTQVFEPIAQYDAAQQRFIATPLDLGPESEQVILLLFGTGIRGRSALNAVSVRVGGSAMEVLYAGAQGGFVGLDQLNVRLGRDLAGRGEVEVLLTADGRAANPVRINIR